MRDWRTTVARGVAVAVVLGSLGVVGMVVYAGGGVAGALARIDPRSLAAVLALVAAAWLADALRYRVMARAVAVTVPVRGWLAIALINQFGAYAINAGAPAAAYALARRGVDGGTAFALTLAKQSLFAPAVLAPIGVLVALDPTLAGGFGVALWLAGGFGLATLVALAAVAMRPAAASRLLVRARVPAAAVERFVGAIATIFRRPTTLAGALALAVVNQAAIAAIVVVVAAGLGIDVNAGLWARALVFSGVSQAAPTPAGAGISEVAGAWLFAPVASPPVVVAFVVVWRLLALQLPIVLGGALLARAAVTAPRS